MDATVATGAAAMMAIRVLLDHDVPEENILVASLLMAASGEYKTNEKYLGIITHCYTLCGQVYIRLPMLFQGLELFPQQWTQR